LFRFFNPSAIEVQTAQIIESFRIIGLERSQLLEGSDCVFRVSQRIGGYGQVKPGISAPGINGKGSLVFACRRFRQPFPQELIAFTFQRLP